MAPEGDVQSTVFRDAGPEQWTDDDQLGEVIRSGESRRADTEDG